MSHAALGPALCLGAVIALAVSAAVCGLIAWAGPVDQPRERGVHASPTPTAGGLGILAGAAAGLIAYTVFEGGDGKIAASVGFAALLGIVGGLDDLYDIGAKPKLLAQLLLSFAFALFVGRIETLPLTSGFSLTLGPVAGVLGTALWLLVATNTVNFMDGANGVAAGGLMIVLLAFAAAALAHGAAALGGPALLAALSTLGFLPWNFPKARLFQGDAGALFTSFLLASLAVIGAGEHGTGPVFVLFAPLALLPFLTDVLLTLLRRARGGRRLLHAHKEHLYQRWFAAHGRSHLKVSLGAWAIVSACSVCAFALEDAPDGVRTGGFILAVFILAAGWARMSRRHP